MFILGKTILIRYEIINKITGNLGFSGRVYLNSAQKMLLKSAKAYFKKLRCARQFNAVEKLKIKYFKKYFKFLNFFQDQKKN